MLTNNLHNLINSQNYYSNYEKELQIIKETSEETDKKKTDIFEDHKEELEKIGYYFKSFTDTEVIMAAYDYWGSECVKKFNGMWSFVIFDNLTNMGYEIVKPQGAFL